MDPDPTDDTWAAITIEGKACVLVALLSGAMVLMLLLAWWLARPGPPPPGPVAEPEEPAPWVAVAPPVPEPLPRSDWPTASHEHRTYPPPSVPTVPSRYARVDAGTFGDYVATYAVPGDRDAADPSSRNLGQLSKALTAYRSALVFLDSEHLPELYEHDLRLMAMGQGGVRGPVAWVRLADVRSVRPPPAGSVHLWWSRLP
jgi:hypothetical protein